jgi:hypothetical protein
VCSFAEWLHSTIQKQVARHTAALSVEAQAYLEQQRFGQVIGRNSYTDKSNLSTKKGRILRITVLRITIAGNIKAQTK